MKVVNPGGSGQIGMILCRDFVSLGWEVVVLGRSQPKKLAAPIRFVRRDGRSQGEWCHELEGSSVVINLAGRSVDCRYSDAHRKQIIDSRVESTQAITGAIAACSDPPPLLLQASTATVYSHRFDQANDDVTGQIGGHEPNVPDTWKFSINVAKAWEAAAMEIDFPHTRRVLMRSAMTMSPDEEGVFDTLLRLVRFGLGGTCGDGQQFMSWIHEADFIRSIHWLIENESLSGPINLSSPHPVSNAEFMRTLRQTWGQRIGLPANRWLLEIGSFLLRTESELILKSRRVTPARLLDSGFTFDYPEWSDAALELCDRW